MTLFPSTIESPPLPSLTHVSPFALRDYQREDAAEVEARWDAGSRGVVCRWATGLGKSLLAAEVCRRMMSKGRVLVVVDVGSLARDLFSTIRRHTGVMPASLTGTLKTDWQDNQIVVATIQSLYAGESGKERYREFKPLEFSCLFIDETESAIAERFGETVRYFVDGNPALKFVGASGTPFRTDKRGMGELFDHAATETGVLNRDILWSVMNGWLVKPRQGFVRCSLDFTTLKVRKNKDGDKDYSEDEISQLMLDQDEQQWRMMAEAIHHAAAGRQSIVMCPNNVEVAKLVAYHIDGAANQEGIANPIFGKQGELAHELLAKFKEKKFRYAVSCQMMGKGFDDEWTQCAFMLRKTKSRRIYEQFLGRAVRPPSAIRAALNAEPDPAARRKLIEESTKPSCVLYDLVGVHPDAKDLGVIDILGDKLPPELREQTKEDMLAAGEIDGEHDTGQAARDTRDKMKAAAAVKAKLDDEDAERRKRAAIEIRGQFEIEMSDDIRTTVNANQRISPSGKRLATVKQARLLIALGVNPDTVMKYSIGQAGAVLSSMTKDGTKPVWSRLDAWERSRRPEVLFAK